MLRIAYVILMISVIAVGLVRIRRSEMVARHEIQNLESYQTSLRRVLWKQQRDIAGMVSPRKVNDRAVRMAIIPNRSGEVLSLANQGR